MLATENGGLVPGGWVEKPRPGKPSPPRRPRARVSAGAATPRGGTSRPGRAAPVNPPPSPPPPRGKQLSPGGAGRRRGGGGGGVGARVWEGGGRVFLPPRRRGKTVDLRRPPP